MNEHFLDIKPRNPSIPLPKRGGFLSVQASEYNYCTPKHNKGPYFSYEVAYFDENDNWCDVPELGKSNDGMVYGWVDKSDVIGILEKEGFSPSQIRKLLPDE
jgi:hypothetical protein